MSSTNKRRRLEGGTLSSSEESDVEDTSAANVDAQNATATPVLDPDGHYLVVNIAGALCTKCNKPVQQRGLKLWIPERKLIKNHWKTNEDYYAGDRMPSSSAAHDKLKNAQIRLYDRLSRQPSEAEGLLREAFPLNDRKKIQMKCCNKCGFSSKDATNHTKHYGQKNKYGCIQEYHQTPKNLTDTVIMNNITKVQMPQKMMQNIIAGTFSLPYQTCQAAASSMPQPSQPQNPPIAQLLSPPTVAQTPQTVPQIVFHASQKEMAAATSPSARPTATKEQEKVNQALRCFADTSKTQTEQQQAVDYAKAHLTTFMGLIDSVTYANDFGKELKEMSVQQDKPFSASSGDNPMLQIILLAGKKWLECGSANLDVTRTMAKHRSMLYQIGSNLSLPNEEALLDGGTFVPKENTYFWP